jgi:hypothetical protein
MIISLSQFINLTPHFNLIGILSQSFEEHTVIWLMISAGIGGLVTEVLKYVFEQYIPQWRLERSTKIAIQKYSYPLLIAAKDLHTVIEEILQSINANIEYDCNKYQHLRILWFFSYFFGWYKLLQNESLLEFSSEKIRSKETKKFIEHYYIALGALSKPAYLINLSNISRAEYGSANVPVLALAAIGELMIKNQKDNDGLAGSELIHIVEFTSKLRSDTDFKIWVPYLERFLSGLNQSYAKRNRLILFDIYLVSLIRFLERFDVHSSSMALLDFLGRPFRLKWKGEIILGIQLESFHKDLDNNLFEVMKAELESLNYRLVRFSTLAS